MKRKVVKNTSDKIKYVEVQKDHLSYLVVLETEDYGVKIRVTSLDMAEKLRSFIDNQCYEMWAWQN